MVTQCVTNRSYIRRKYFDLTFSNAAAIAEGPDALYWNPAGLTQIHSNALSFSHSAYLESSFFDYAAYAHKMENGGAFGVGLQYLSSGKITEVDNNGNNSGEFNPNDAAVSVGYSHLLNGFSLGVAAKYIRSKIVDSASTGAIDLGVMSPDYVNGKVRLAIAALNVGGKMKFDQRSKSLPMVFKLGGVIRPIKQWQNAVDVGFPKDNGPYVAIGTEYLLPISGTWALAGRAGFNSRTLNDVSGLTGVSMGFGLSQKNFNLIMVLLHSERWVLRIAFLLEWIFKSLVSALQTRLTTCNLPRSSLSSSRMFEINAIFNANVR